MSIEALDSFDDDFLLRNIPNVLASSPFTPTTPTLAPPRSHLSSIAPAAPREPTLAAAQPNMMYKILGSHMETERLTTKSAQNFDAEVTQNLAEIEKLSAEREEALQEEAKASKSRDTWSTLSTISQYITSVGAIAVGAACGGIPAVLLIGAGVVGVGNRVLHDTHLLQAAVSWWTTSVELQQKITHNIEMGAFILQMGLGLAGGIWAIQTGALAAAANSTTFLGITKKAASIITGASTIAGAGAKVGSEIYNKRISDLQAKMNEIGAEMTTGNHTMTQDTFRIGRMIDSTRDEGDMIKNAIQTLQISLD